MSNFILKFKFGLKARFGLIPGTSRIEARDQELKNKYNEFLDYEKSGKPQRFIELEEIVNSQDFRDNKKFIQNQRFKDTDAYVKLTDYKTMKDSPEFKGYFRFIKSKYFEDFLKYYNSNEIAKLEAAGEDEKGKYADMKGSPGVKAYYKLSKSGDMDHFLKLHDSPSLKKFKDLESYVNSDEFRETKELMKSRDRFKKTPEYRQLEEYRELKKSKKHKWYNKVKVSGKFDELKIWEPAFSDDFTGKEVDNSKWLTTYFWGNQLLKGSYSIATDKHFYTDGKNHEVNDSLLKLHTRKEDVSGQAWDPVLGFYPKDFEFTSGLVNTGESFRQLYGAFEAKIRMHHSPSVYHAFWMLSDKMVPHIDIFRFSGKNKKRLEFNVFRAGNGNTKEIRRNSDSIGGIDFSRGFFIYRLEWTPDRIVWKINNTVVKTYTGDIPKEPMYILLSSGVESNGTEAGLPTSMDIDWVKCYRYIDDIKT